MPKFVGALLFLGCALCAFAIPLPSEKDAAMIEHPLTSRRLLLFSIPSSVPKDIDHRALGADRKIKNYDASASNKDHATPRWAVRITALIGLMMLSSYGVFLAGCLIHGFWKRHHRGYAQLAVEEPRQAVAQAATAAKHGAEKSKHTLKDFWHKSKEKLHIGAK
jgi:hypothetical protein